jgi:hypothetical protein
MLLALAIATAVLSIVFGFKPNLKLFVFTSALAAAIAVEIAGSVLLPNLDPFVSARDRANWITEAPQAQFYTFHLQRSWNYGLAFYAEHPIEEWSPDNPAAASLFTTSQGLIELKKLGRFSGSVNPAERGIRYVKIGTAAR